MARTTHGPENPSGVVAKAASGVQCDAPSNGKPDGVVLGHHANLRSRWISTAAIKALLALAGTPGHNHEAGHRSTPGPNSTDGTGWAEELRTRPELDNDRILDPWDAESQDSGPA